MSADPRTQFDLVESFWRQLVALDQRVVARARRTVVRRQRRRMLVLAVLLLLALAAALAVATGVFDRGSDIKSTNPTARILALARLPGTLRVVATTPDPDGGPPWALRMFRSESEDCFQIGRLVNGRLAAIGIGGAFANDRRYHALPVEPLYCGGNRSPHLSHAGGGGGTFSVSGLEDEDSCRPPAPEFTLTLAPICDEGLLRGVIAGTGGRHLLAVTLVAEGHLLTQRITDRTNGSYMFVVRGRAPQRGHVLGLYDDGSVCPMPAAVIDDTRISRRCDGRVRAP